MLRKSTFFLIFSLFSVQMGAQTYSYSIGTPYSGVIRLDSSASCGLTLYDPEVINLSADTALDKTLRL